LHFGDRQTGGQTDEKIDRPVAWSLSRCRDRRLNNKGSSVTFVVTVDG